MNSRQRRALRRCERRDALKRDVADWIRECVEYESPPEGLVVGIDYGVGPSWSVLQRVHGPEASS